MGPFDKITVPEIFNNNISNLLHVLNGLLIFGITCVKQPERRF